MKTKHCVFPALFVSLLFVLSGCSTFHRTNPVQPTSPESFVGTWIQTASSHNNVMQPMLQTLTLEQGGVGNWTWVQQGLPVSSSISWQVDADTLLLSGNDQQLEGRFELQGDSLLTFDWTTSGGISGNDSYILWNGTHEAFISGIWYQTPGDSVVTLSSWWIFSPNGTGSYVQESGERPLQWGARGSYLLILWNNHHGYSRPYTLTGDTLRITNLSGGWTTYIR